MKIVDANVILRYLLNDTEELSEKATEILENNKVFIPKEVIAEIIYVLEKVYKVENTEISNILLELFNYYNLQVSDSKLINNTLNLYSNRKLDFIDTSMYAYHKVRNCEVYTFDKELNKLLD